MYRTELSFFIVVQLRKAKARLSNTISIPLDTTDCQNNTEPHLIWKAVILHHLSDLFGINLFRNLNDTRFNLNQHGVIRASVKICMEILDNSLKWQ